MDEYVKRRAVLDLIVDVAGGYKYIETDTEHLIERLWAIPAANVVERKKGKWMYDCERIAGDGWTYRQHHCTVCGFQSIAVSHYQFCPNCGAVMEV